MFLWSDENDSLPPIPGAHLYIEEFWQMSIQNDKHHVLAEQCYSVLAVSSLFSAAQKGLNTDVDIIQNILTIISRST